MPVEIMQTQFPTEVMHATLPVILVFFSPECPPCEALTPKFVALAEAFAGRAKFLKISLPANRPLAKQWGVAHSPTIIFFRQGQEVGRRLSGMIKKSELQSAVEALLAEYVPRPNLVYPAA